MNNVAIPLHERPTDYVFNMTTLNSSDAKRLWRAAIKEAWKNRCAYCNQPPIDDKSLTIDHVKPKARGGEDRTTNCIPACRRCNADKGSELWVTWYRMQPFYSLEAELRIRHWLKTGQTILPNDRDDNTAWLDEQISALQSEEIDSLER